MPCPVTHTNAKGEKQKAEFKLPADVKEGDHYIKWNAPGVETIPDGEAKTIKDVSDQFNRLQLMNFNDHMHCYRGTHLKTQGCVAGKFIVHDGLPKHLAQGMFKQPGTYDCIMRYSSLLPLLVPDSAPAPRGIGIKIFGIKGEKIWGEDKETQDWTMNNYPVLELRTPKATNEIIDSLERNFHDIPAFAEELGKREDHELATVPVKLPRQQMVAMPEYSQSAYRHGHYVAKYGVFPLGEAQKKLEDSDEVKEDDSVNVLSTKAREFHLHNKVTYAFCAQMLENLEEQPVDDIGIEWDPVKYPFIQLATMEFPPQDSFLPEFRTWWDDRITVNSWHGLKEHQPLGSTNRMRRVVYAESRKLRMQVNGFKDYIEPGSINEVPVPISVPTLPLQS